MSALALIVEWKHNSFVVIQTKGYVLKQAKVLSEAELKRLWMVVAAGRHPKRNRVALLLSHYAGLRVGEIAALTWGDLLEVSGEIKLRFILRAALTKSNEARSVHINAKLAKELTAYRQTFKKVSADAPLIASQRGGAFSANSLCQLLGRLYAAAGIDGGSSHSGRRWFITNLAHKGVSAKIIMVLAGHKSLTTTQRYIDVNDVLLSRAVEVL